MEINGFAVSGIMAAIAAFVTQAVKQAIPEQMHRYIPIPLALVLVGIGVFFAWYRGTDLLAGGIEGFVAAALAVYGYEFVKMFRPA
jgi:hypothetical protein